LDDGDDPVALYCGQGRLAVAYKCSNNVILALSSSQLHSLQAIGPPHMMLVLQPEPQTLSNAFL